MAELRGSRVVRRLEGVSGLQGLRVFEVAGLGLLRSEKVVGSGA